MAGAQRAGIGEHCFPGGGRRGRRGRRRPSSVVRRPSSVVHLAEVAMPNIFGHENWLSRIAAILERRNPRVHGLRCSWIAAIHNPRMPQHCGATKGAVAVKKTPQLEC